MVTKPAVRIETLRRPGAGRNRRAALLGAATALIGAGAAQAAAPGALPQDPTVAGGAATFARSGQTLTVNQSTSRAVIDWRSFDIGSGAQTTFNQLGASAIAVNRINAGTDPTHIDGALRANGQVWILNPNGVMFGKGATVNVAGIVASTANIDAGRFMAGDNRLTFTGADRGFVANEGAITVADNGLAAFVAPSVRNSGAINARVGKVTLAAGSTFTLDLAGDRLIEIGLGAGHAVVDQSGSIVDEGGVVTLSARSAGQVVDSVINMSGVVSTASARQVGGQIVLEGDAASLTGAADASGTSGGRITLAANTIGIGPQATLRADSVANGDGGTITAIAAVHGDYAGAYSARGGPAGGDGGKIETSGASVAIDGAIKVDASAAKGAAGEWLIDPLDVTITSGSGGGFTGSTVTTGAIQTALAGGTGVHITTDQTGTDNGDLTLASSITANATGNAGLTLDGRHLSAIGGSVINIAGGALTLNVNTVNALADVSGQPTNWIQDADSMIGAVSGGTRINLGAATYANSATIDRSRVFLDGSAGALINVNPGSTQVFGLAIAGGTSGVTINGFNILGEITGSYVNYIFGTGSSRGIAVVNTATGFHITNNTIKNVRTGVLVDGRDVTGASITHNLIDNTKTAVFLQYTAGAGINITGNSQGPFGNEWGGNFHVNGDYDDAPGTLTQPGGDAPSGVQAALLASKAANNGWSVQDQAYATSNRTNVIVSTAGSDSNQGSPKATLASIQKGIAAVVAGGEVDVANGTYVIDSSVPYLGITKSLSLVGQSQAGTVIDAHAASQYGLRVTADNVSLRNFTLLGVTAAGSSYGIKVENNTDPSPDARIHNLSIANVTSHGARKAQLDLNGVVGASIDHFTADGTSNGFGSGSQAGAGIAITDSANVTITNSATHDNAWAGLALYETNVARNQQVTGITVDATHFAESVPVYAEDTSSSKDFGALTIGGLPYVVHSPTDPADVFTWFSRTQQDAIDLAILKGATTATVESYAGSGLAGNNSFWVGVSSLSPTSTMSIKAALDAAQTGALVTVNDGTYVIPGGGTSYLAITKGLTLKGTSQAGTIIDARGATAYGLRVQADNVSLSKFTLLGSKVTGGYGVKVEPLNLADPNARVSNFAIDHVTIDGATKNTLDLNGALNATIDSVTAKNAVAGNGIALIDSANVAITNSTTANNAWGGLRIEEKNASFNQRTDAITVAASNSFGEASPVYLEDDSASKDFGTVSIAGFGYAVKAPSSPADVYTWLQKTQQGAIDFAAAQSLSTGTVQSYSGSGFGDNSFIVGFSTGGRALSIQAAVNSAQAGGAINIAGGAYAQSVTGNSRLNYSFGAGTTLSGFTLQAGAAGSGLSGSLTASSIALGSPVILLGDLALNTRAAGGAISAGAIDASAPGGQALTLDAGTGLISLGSLGASARLGGVQAVSSTTLTGDTYNAASLAFGGDVVLTAGQTTVNTAPTAGNITVAGSLLGSADAAQSLALVAGSGDISLQNVGAKAVRLNNLSVSGDDFGAQTVDLAGNFTARLTGNQVFSSHTLNAGGQVDSAVGGNASGPVNAGGSVSLAVTGDLTGSIVGTDVALNAGTLTNAAVSASQSASISAGAVAGSTVAGGGDVTVNTGAMTNSSLSSSQAINLAASAVSGATLAAPKVAAKADSFSGNVNASNSASITGGDISGTFTGGSFKIAGTGAVNANVTAASVSVDAPKGTITGTWQSLDTGSSGRGVSVNNQPVNVQGSGVSANQIVVENFTLPTGSVVTKTGEIILPQGQMIGLLSPGGASGAPKLIQVSTVQQLGSLLAEGYTAIIIDLSGHEKASNDDQPVKVSQR